MDKSYLEYNHILILLLIGVSIRFLLGPFSSFLIMTDHLIENLFRVIVFLFIYVFLIYLLINKFSLIAVPVAYLISTVINFLILNYFYIKKLEFNFMTIIIK